MKEAMLVFERLIRRALAPSVTFVFAFLVVDLVSGQVGGEPPPLRLSYWLGLFRHFVRDIEGVVGVLAVIAVLGLGFALGAVQQVLFDNTLRKDFEASRALWWLKSETGHLSHLREEVLAKLKKQEVLEALGRQTEEVGDTEERFTDWILYEILGGLYSGSIDSFVDSARALGVVFSSLIVALLGSAIYRYPENPSWLLWAVALAVFFGWVGHETVKTQYRHRALRLYVSFLMLPPERIWRIVQGQEPSGAWPEAGKELFEKGISGSGASM